MPCPSAIELADYLLGRSSDQDAEALSQHVADCGECQATITRLPTTDDTLIDRLRASVDDCRYEQEPAYRYALESVLELIADTTLFGREPQPAAADFCEIDLVTLVRTVGPLPVAEACELICQAARRLAQARQFGFAHRQIHPSHLLLTSDGVVNLLDFGLELEAPSPPAAELTSPGSVLGAIDYLAPEQTIGHQPLDVRAELYRLGATLYWLLTAHLPFDDSRYKTPLVKLMALVHEPPAPLHLWRSDLPADLVGIVERLLAKRPEDRPATPGEVAEALQAYTAGADLGRLIESARVQPQTASPRAS